MSTPSEVSTQRPFPFLSLPAELRLQIYHACMDLRNEDDDSIMVSDGFLWSQEGQNSLYRFFDRAPVCKETEFTEYINDLKASCNTHLYYSLLRSCRTIRAEAIHIFHNHDHPIPSIKHLYAFLLSIGRVRRSELQQLAFVYHLPFKSTKRKYSTELDILTSKCFRLMKRECHKLQTLRVYMNIEYMKMYLKAQRVIDFQGSPDVPMFVGHLSDILESSSTYDIRMVLGTPLLLSLKGFGKVIFEPATGAADFDQQTRSALDGFAQEMMRPLKKKEMHETVHETKKRKLETRK